MPEEELQTGDYLDYICREVDNCPLVLPYYGFDQSSYPIPQPLYFTTTFSDPGGVNPEKHRAAVSEESRLTNTKDFVEGPFDPTIYLRYKRICNEKFGVKGTPLRMNLRLPAAPAIFIWQIRVEGFRISLLADCDMTFGPTISYFPQWQGIDKVSGVSRILEISEDFAGVSTPYVDGDGSGNFSVDEHGDWILATTFGTLTSADGGSTITSEGVIRTNSDGSLHDGRLCISSEYFTKITLGLVFFTTVDPEAENWRDIYDSPDELIDDIGDARDGLL